MKNNQHRQTALLSIAAIILFSLGFTSGCRFFKSSATTVDWTPPPAGQKLNGYYEHGIVPKESYMFKEDGSYIYDSGDKTESAVKGTYRIEGETIRLEAGGKTNTKTISVPKEDVGKSSPLKVDLNYGTFEFVSDEQLAQRKKNSTVSTSSEKDNTPPTEYAKFAPAQVGAFARVRVAPYRADSKDVYKEAVRFIYDAKNYVDIKKYTTEGDAQAEFKKRVSAAVPSTDYDKKVKLPKCDTNKETDYDSPEELVKKLLVNTGGSEAFVFHSSKFWDYKCQKVSNSEENVVWTNGVYVFEIISLVENTSDDYTKAFGRAEVFFNDYQKAVEQK